MSIDICLTANESLNVTLEKDNSSTVSLVQPKDYPFVYQIISVIMGVVIFLVGMLGNILVIVVVCRTKCMHTPTNCYLLSLSVADCLVLLSATLPSIPEPFFHTGEWPWGGATCSLLVFLQYLGVQASSLSITMFTIERYIAICHPMKAQRMCTVQRAKRIIIAIWIFTTLYCAPWLGLTVVVSDPRTQVATCAHRLEREKYLAYYLTDLIAFYIAPLLVSGILYGLIARILFINTIPRSKSQEKHYPKSDKYRVKTSTFSSRKQVTLHLCICKVHVSYHRLLYAKKFRDIATDSGEISYAFFFNLDFSLLWYS
jgi:thyrotropin-releasing hormone receptor